MSMVKNVRENGSDIVSRICSANLNASLSGADFPSCFFIRFVVSRFNRCIISLGPYTSFIF